jgi:glycosyltransferase involved in cell wall biosynthesis
MTEQPSRRLVIVTNVAWFFVSHRLPMAVAAREAGWEVHVVATPDETVPHIRSAGLAFHPLDIGRSGFGVRDGRALRALTALYRELRPSLAHHVTIKSVLLGSLAARDAGVPAVINAYSGLGTLFIARGPLARPRRHLVLRVIAWATRGRNVVSLFQNDDDRQALVSHGVVSMGRTVIIPGSGVDLERFKAGREPDGVPLVVLPARMLRDKGVLEFATAARIVEAEGRIARFALVGPLDPHNASAITQAELDALVGGALTWWGPQADMAAVLAQACVVALPSYGEGLPKVLAEAAAAGRAIVTTDVPGCRDVVEDGVSGLIVPPRDSGALARALARLLDDPALRTRLGAAARRRAEERFDLRAIVRQTLALYDQVVIPS